MIGRSVSKYITNPREDAAWDFLYETKKGGRKMKYIIQAKSIDTIYYVGSRYIEWSMGSAYICESYDEAVRHIQDSYSYIKENYELSIVEIELDENFIHNKIVTSLVYLSDMDSDKIAKLVAGTGMSVEELSNYELAHIGPQITNYKSATDEEIIIKNLKTGEFHKYIHYSNDRGEDFGTEYIGKVTPKEKTIIVYE